MRPNTSFEEQCPTRTPTALSGQHHRPTVILDPAPAAGAAALLGDPAVEVVTPSETEAAALAEALSTFEGTVVRTRGPDPVVVESPDGRSEVDPPPAAPVDTTGADDVFAGYLRAELARGAALRTAVGWACTAASLSVESAGVQRATRDRAAVRRRVDRRAPARRVGAPGHRELTDSTPVISKRAPPVSPSVTATVQSWAPAISRTIARPNPVPSSDVV